MSVVLVMDRELGGEDTAMRDVNCDICINNGRCCRECIYQYDPDELGDYYEPQSEDDLRAYELRQRLRAEAGLVIEEIEVYSPDPAFLHQLLTAKAFCGAAEVRPDYASVYIADDYLLATDTYTMIKLCSESIPDALKGRSVINFRARHCGGDTVLFRIAKNGIPIKKAEEILDEGRYIRFDAGDLRPVPIEKPDYDGPERFDTTEFKVGERTYHVQKKYLNRAINSFPHITAIGHQEQSISPIYFYGDSGVALVLPLRNLGERR